MNQPMEPRPTPPVTAVVDGTGQTILTVGTSVVAAIVLALVVGVAVKHRSIWPLIIIASGFIMFPLEPVYDDSFHIWFYNGGDIWPFYTSYGMVQPIWVPITYLWIYGGPALLVARRVEAGLSRRGVIKLAVFVYAVFTIFELVGVNLGVYGYYGSQAFQIAGFPIWMSVNNTAICIVGGVLFAHMRKRLEARAVWASVITMPLVFGALSLGAAFPFLAVANMPETEATAIWIASAASTVVGALALYLTAQTLPTREGTFSGQRTVAVHDDAPWRGGSRRGFPLKSERASRVNEDR